jgi:hypothetical protein
MKTCGICLIEKDLNDFYNDSSKKDGKASKCKQCRKEKLALVYIVKVRLD